jgi:DNA-binding NarL/FixJ family response regulator
MDDEKPRKTTPVGRSARNKRIVERLREGFGFHEIAREEKLSDRRVRQIVKQALDAGPPFANLHPVSPWGTWAR